MFLFIRYNFCTYTIRIGTLQLSKLCDLVIAMLPVLYNIAIVLFEICASRIYVRRIVTDSELRNSFLQDHRISLFLITLKCGSPHPKVAKILQRSIFIVVGYLQLASIAFLNFVIAFVNVEELVGRLCESLYWCHCHQRYQCYQFHRHVSLSFLRVTCLVSLPSGFVGSENLGVVSLLKAV